MPRVTLHQARLGFKFSKQTENKSPRTVEWYEANLERFETFLAGRALDAGDGGSPALADLTTDDLRQFIAHLQGKQVIFENHKYHKPIQRPLSPHTIRGVVASLSAFFGWAMRDGLIVRNPMDKIVKPKVPRVIKERFSQEDIEKLIEACRQYTDTLAVRNHAIVLFLLSTGVRAGELVGLTLDRLDLEHRRAHVTGKGMKDRNVFLGKTAVKVVWQYVTVYRPAEAPTNCVFVTREGQPMTVERLEKMLSDLGARAGVAHVHPHRFRHTAARLLLRNGANAFEVQSLLGHESMQTTRLYVELEREDLERASLKADPCDNWNLK